MHTPDETCLAALQEPFVVLELLDAFIVRIVVDVDARDDERERP